MAKIGAYGAALKRGATTVANLRTLSGPSLSAETLDVSTHDGAGYREFVASLLDPGELTAEIVWDPANATHTAFITDLVARTITTWHVVWPDAGAADWAFSAMVTGFAPSAPVDGELSASVTLKISGAITITP